MQNASLGYKRNALWKWSAWVLFDKEKGEARATLERKYNLNKGIKVSMNLGIQRANWVGMKNNENYNRMNMPWSNYWEPF